ncbi:MAG: GH3 auxin-responsive promoter family protein [Polyangiaceae bacterium]
MKTPPLGAISGPAFWAASKLRVAQWDSHARDPEKVQLATLLSLCDSAKNTEIGRALRLGDVRGYRDFQDRVPLRSYAEYEPYFLRMRAGERDVLWPGLVPYFCQSSGTSNTPANVKHLPVSEQQIVWQQASGVDLAARYVVMSGDKAFTSGYTLACWPPGVLKTEGPVQMVSNPGLMSHRMPRISRLINLPEPEIRDIEDCETKLTRMAEAYLDHDVRAMSGTTCWFSLVFDRLLAAARARGRRVTTVSEIWPHLKVLFGGGVPSSPYRPAITERFGKPLVFIDNYNATEGGILAATDQDGDESLLILPHRGVFFELVRREEHGDPGARRVPLWEAELGVDYSVALTTSSGLFGYLIGDLVRFTSLFPHRIVFAGRVSGMLSLTQELTTSLELERAVESAVAEVPCAIVDFAAATEVRPEDGPLGRYLFFIEFERAPEDMAAFTRAVDRGLCRQNHVYEIHRENQVAILPPEVIPLVAGGARRFMAALGQESFQRKFPRVLDPAKREAIRAFERRTQEA